MRYVQWSLWIILFYSLSACKFDSADDKQQTSSAKTTTFAAHCSTAVKIKTTGKGLIGSEEKTLQVSFSTYQFVDGHFETSCNINDGKRQYNNESSLSANKALYRNPGCSIMYDLGADAEGTFYFSYQSDWSWVSYTDDQDVQKDIKFRSDECVEL